MEYLVFTAMVAPSLDIEVSHRSFLMTVVILIEQLEICRVI